MSSPEQNYFLWYAMRYPVFRVAFFRSDFLQNPYFNWSAKIWVGGGVDRPPFPKTLLHTMCQITVSKGHLWKIFRFIAQCGKIFFWQDSLISHGLAATSTVADRKIESTNPGMNFFSKDFFFHLQSILLLCTLDY